MNQPIKIHIAVAVITQNACMLIQLRDDDPNIVAPGCWGLFGGHIEVNETPNEAVLRELHEEIGWKPKEINFWFKYETDEYSINVFKVNLNVDIKKLNLYEGQDVKLATYSELRKGKIWSHLLSEYRDCAPIIRKVIDHI